MECLVGWAAGEGDRLFAYRDVDARELGCFTDGLAVWAFLAGAVFPPLLFGVVPELEVGGRAEEGAAPGVCVVEGFLVLDGGLVCDP